MSQFLLEAYFMAFNLIYISNTKPSSPGILIFFEKVGHFDLDMLIRNKHIFLFKTKDMWLMLVYLCYGCKILVN